MEGLKVFLEGFTTILNTIINYLNPFSENFILLKLWDFLTTIVDYINPFSDNFILLKLWEFLINIISYINPFDENFFGYKIIELLGDLLEFLFIPSEDRINGLINTVTSKFAFIDSIKIAINSLQDIIDNLGNSPSLSLTLSATPYTPEQEIKVIDMSWYAPYKSYGDVVITGFIYAFFLWRFFALLPNIISGYGNYSEDVYQIERFESRGGKK